VAIAANGYHSLALRADGSIVAWGRNTDHQTNVPPPNADFGIAAMALNPGFGSVTGGYAVAISGYFLGGDITNVTLAGIGAASIVSQSASQIVVIAGTAPGPQTGDVRAYATGAGELVLSENFHYLGEQTILFPNPGPQRTTNILGLAATASSGLPVSFFVFDGPGSLSGGTNLSFTASGTVTVVASQPGDSEWFAAPSITNVFLVEKTTAPVTLANLIQTFDGTPRMVTADTVPPGLTVMISYDGTTNPPVAAGTYAITGVVDDVMYTGQATGALHVLQATGLIVLQDTFATYDGQAKTVSVSTTPTGLVVYITYEGQTNAPVNAGAYEVIALIVEQNFAGSVTDTLVIAKADQSISFGEIPDQITTNRLGLAATASSGLPVAFSVAVGTATISGGTNLSFTGAGLVGISASQAGNTNWNAAGGSLSFFNVSKANQSIGFAPIGTQQFTNQVGLAATASSGLPVAFAVGSGPAVISGGTNLTFNGTGEVSIVASQAGDAIWNEAPMVFNTFTVEGSFFLLTVSAGPNGSVGTTSGWYAANSIVPITATPNAYYHFTNWTGDAAGSNVFANPLNLLMNGPKSITAIFAEDTTTSGVSIPWMVGYGITNDFEAAVLLDPDEDGVVTGDEYITDTDPLGGDSYLAVENLRMVAAQVILTIPVSTDRVYDLERSPNVPGAIWPKVAGYTNIMPATTTLVLTNPALDSTSFYRLRARR
jgi:hypothetical protein